MSSSVTHGEWVGCLYLYENWAGVRFQTRGMLMMFGIIRKKDIAVCPYCLPLWLALIGFGLYTLVLLFG